VSTHTAVFLYRDGKTLYFEVDGSICGFVSDSLSSPDKFQRVMETVMDKEGAVPLNFLTRNSVLISRPKKDPRVFSESYKKLKSFKESEPLRETTKEFKAGFALGKDIGYGEGIIEGRKEKADGESSE